MTSQPPADIRRVHPVAVGFEQDLEVLTKGRRKKGVQRSVFRKQSNFVHCACDLPSRRFHYAMPGR